jgi:hypothetical protein
MITHRQIISGLSAMFLTVVLCGCRTGAGHPVIPIRPPYSAAEIAGHWVGFTTSDLCLLELRADNTGTLTQAYEAMTNWETLRFEISRWDIATNNVLTCSFRQHDVHDPVLMTCDVKGDHLQALLRNGVGGWTEEVVFWREKVLDEALRILRQ